MPKLGTTKGLPLGELGKPQEAIRLLIKPSRSAQTMPKLVQQRGCSWSLRQASRSNLRAYDQAIKIKPDNAEAWYNKGTALAVLGKLQEALRLLIKPSRSSRTMPKLGTTKGWLLESRKA